MNHNTTQNDNGYRIRMPFTKVLGIMKIVHCVGQLYYICTICGCEILMYMYMYAPLYYMYVCGGSLSDKVGLSQSSSQAEYTITLMNMHTAHSKALLVNWCVCTYIHVCTYYICSIHEIFWDAYND